MALVKTKYNVTLKKDSSARWYLCSDLHFGSRYNDIDRLNAEFKEAMYHDADILINGDVFDAIFKKDLKRFRPSILIDELQGRDDIADAAVEYATKVLKPYVKKIRGISVGNHEGAANMYHDTDLVRRLIQNLNAEGGKIEHLDYCGIINFYINDGNNVPIPSGEEGKQLKFRMYYHHGFGGHAPVTKGAIDYARIRAWAGTVDMVWMGHKHMKNVFDLAVLDDHNQLKEVKDIRTGSFQNFFDWTESRDIMEGGRKGTYVAEMGAAPQALGGVFLKFNRYLGNIGFRVEH